MGAVFAKLFLLFDLGKKTTQNQSIFIIFFGVAATLIWYEMGLNFAIYESTIGLIAGLMAYPLAKLFIK